MEQKYLIDTNILIAFIGKILPEKGRTTISIILSEEFNISFINKIEVLGHSSADKTLATFINLANVFEINDAIIDQTIAIRRNYKIKLPDAIIAATAITEDLILVTRNVSDFKNIKDIELLNPWEL